MTSSSDRDRQVLYWQVERRSGYSSINVDSRSPTFFWAFFVEIGKYVLWDEADEADEAVAESTAIKRS
jgi:hypothetical protein